MRWTAGARVETPLGSGTIVELEGTAVPCPDGLGGHYIAQPRVVVVKLDGVGQDGTRHDGEAPRRSLTVTFNDYKDFERFRPLEVSRG